MSSEPAASAPAGETSSRPLRRVFRRLAIGLGLAGILVGIWFLYRAQIGLTQARQLAARGHWRAARLPLERYLWLHRADDRGRLLMAEAFVKDEALPADESAPLAIAQLVQIPSSSPRAAEARVRQAQLQFLLQFQPFQAERVVREAIQLAPDSFEGHYLLWKILDMTGRSQFAEPAFWIVYEQTPPEQQAERLREWYMSQFFPATANPELDRKMGFADGSQSQNASTEFIRIREFRNRERDSPTAHAALARWVQNEGDHQFALQLLQEAEALADAFDDPYFVATLVSLQFELGDFDSLEPTFNRWPPPHDGFEYWKWKAIVAEEVHRDYKTALAAYFRAVAIWPGQADWRTQFRLAHCLTKLGETRRAEEIRTSALQVEKQMDREIHRRLRDDLKELQDPSALRRITSFYSALGRTREVACWRQVIDRLATADRSE